MHTERYLFKIYSLGGYIFISFLYLKNINKKYTFVILINKYIKYFYVSFVSKLFDFFNII